jgi:hypothetical protein
MFCHAWSSGEQRDVNVTASQFLGELRYHSGTRSNGAGMAIVAHIVNLTKQAIWNVLNVFRPQHRMLHTLREDGVIRSEVSERTVATQLGE